MVSGSGTEMTNCLVRLMPSSSISSIVLLMATMLTLYFLRMSRSISVLLKKLSGAASCVRLWSSASSIRSMIDGASSLLRHRSADSRSGFTTSSAPMRVSIFPRMVVVARDITLPTPICLRMVVVRAASSKSAPIPTMATSTLSMPWAISACSSVLSRLTASVTLSRNCAISSLLRSTAITSAPESASSVASRRPKRPSPITANRCMFSPVYYAFCRIRIIRPPQAQRQHR